MSSVKENRSIAVISLDPGISTGVAVFFIQTPKSPRVEPASPKVSIFSATTVDIFSVLTTLEDLLSRLSRLASIVLGVREQFPTSFIDPRLQKLSQEIDSTFENFQINVKTIPPGTWKSSRWGKVSLETLQGLTLFSPLPETDSKHSDDAVRLGLYYIYQGVLQ